MNKNELTEKQMERLYRRVITDDTYWDDMTAVELEKRIETFREHDDNIDKLVALLSCLRLAEIVYLRRKEPEGWAIPIIERSDGQVYIFFTEGKHILNTYYKAYDKETSRLQDILENLDVELNAKIVLNPDTQNVMLSYKTIKDFFCVFDDIVVALDKKMEEGIKGDELDDITFEHFFTREIQCELKDRTKIKGNAFMCKKTKQLGPMLFVETEQDDSIIVYMNKVKFIKDITALSVKN